MSGRAVAATVAPGGAVGTLIGDVGGSTTAVATPQGRLTWTIPETWTGGATLVLGASGYQSQSVRCILDAELKFADTDPPSSHPLDLVKLGLSRIQTSGRQFVTESGDGWGMKGCSDFALGNLFRLGQDITPILQQRKDAGANTLRIFTMWAADPAFQLPTLDWLPDVLTLLELHQLYAEVVALCDCQVLLPDQAHQHARVDFIAGILSGRPHFFQLGNEYQKNGFDPYGFPRPEGVMLASRGSNIQDGNVVNPAWDYVSHHPARKNTWEWVVKGTDAIYQQRLGLGNGVSDKPLVYGEIEKAGADWTDPEAYRVFSQISLASGAAGVTFHSVAGLTSALWDDTQYQCAVACYQGLG
jgi:hypothetical protein